MSIWQYFYFRYHSKIKHSNCKTIDFHFNSTRVLVKSWLFCIQNFPMFIKFWCMLGVGVEDWMKNIRYQFTDNQTHFNMPSGCEYMYMYPLLRLSEAHNQKKGLPIPLHPFLIFKVDKDIDDTKNIAYSIILLKFNLYMSAASSRHIATQAPCLTLKMDLGTQNYKIECPWECFYISEI